MSAIKRLAKAIIKPSSAVPYHVFHARQAQAIEAGLKDEKGALSAPLARRCEEYATEVLGGKHYAPWLRVYSQIAGEFREGWIPDNYYGSVVVPLLKGAYGGVSRLKPLNAAILPSAGFPDLGSFVNGLFLNTNYQVIPETHVVEWLFEKHNKLVFKVDNTSQGKGIYFFTRDTFDPTAIHKLGNGVFQHYIEQHPDLQSYAPGSVATLRITSVTDDEGTAHIKAAYLRLGSGSDTHVQSGSHIRVPVDIATGALSEHGYLPSWHLTDKHPTSGKTFAGQSIPHYEKCLAVVKACHQKIPFARVIGWDLAVDNQANIAIMEWNGAHNDIKFSEAVQGPCFAGLGWEKLWRVKAQMANS